MGVHSDYRRIEIANKLIEEMLTCLSKDSETTIITFRTEDEKALRQEPYIKVLVL